MKTALLLFASLWAFGCAGLALRAADLAAAPELECWALAGALIITAVNFLVGAARQLAT